MRSNQPVPPALRPPATPDIPRLALRPDEAAASLGICSKTLRELPGGPPTVSIGRIKLYRVASLDAWLATQERRAETPASDGAADSAGQ
jgi:hypothetical protein